MSMPRNMLESKLQTNDQDAFSGVLACISGGTLGDPPNIANVSYGMVRLRVTSVVDPIIYQPAFSVKEFVVIAPNNVADPMDATQLLYPPQNIAAIPAVLTAAAAWTTDNIGCWPVDFVIPRDYQIEANFETGFKICDELCVTPLMLQAGNTPLQGSIVSAAYPSPIPRVTLNKPGILANVSGPNDFNVTGVDSVHTVIGTGDGTVSTFAGNNVDDPDLYQFNRVITVGNVTGVPADYAVAFAGTPAQNGGIPDYYTGPVNVDIIVNGTIPALGAGFTIKSLIQVTADYATVTAAGVLVIRSSTVSNAAYVTGALQANQPFGNEISARLNNPTKDPPFGYTSYLIGVRCNIEYYSESAGVAAAVNAVQIRANIRMPNQGVGFRAGHKVVVVSGYVGQINVLHNQHWAARPNAGRQADYRNQMCMPFPTYLKDAVTNAIYTVFGPAMARAFKSRDEFMLYRERLEDPSNLINWIGHGEPGVNPSYVSDESQAESMHSTRAPILRAATYRQQAGLPSSTYHAAVWPHIARILGIGFKKALPFIEPAARGLLDSLFDSAREYKVDDSSGIPMHSARYGGGGMNAARYGGSRMSATGYTADESSDEGETTPSVEGDPDDVMTVVTRICELGQSSPVTIHSPDQTGVFTFDDDDVKVHSVDRRPIYHVPQWTAMPIINVAFKSAKKARFHAADNDGSKPIKYVPKPEIRLMAAPVVRDFDHRGQVAAVLHSAGYRMNDQAVNNAVKQKLGLPVAGKLTSSKANTAAENEMQSMFGAMEEPTFNLENDPNEGEFVTDLSPAGDIDFGLDEEEKKVPHIEPAREPAQPARTGVNAPFLSKLVEYPELTGDTLNKLGVAVAQGYYYDLSISGAGPVVSSQPAARLAGVRLSPVSRVFLNSAANFMLVGKSGVYIGQICVTSLPLHREYGKQPGTSGEHTTFEQALKATYALRQIVIRRQRDGVADDVSYSIGYEFDQSCYPAIERAIRLYLAAADPSTHHRYISIHIPDHTLAPGDVDGDSFSIALYCALLGLPIGPAMTGSLDDQGRVKRVGKLSEKLHPFMSGLSADLWAPLIFPEDGFQLDSLPPTNYRNVGIWANIGNYSMIMSMCRVLPVRTISDVVHFFTNGGYDLWQARMDKTGKKVATMDRLSAVANTATTLRHLLNHRSSIALQVQREKTSSKPQEEIKANLRKLQEQYKDLESRRMALAAEMTQPQLPLSEKKADSEQRREAALQQTAVAAKAERAWSEYANPKSKYVGKWKSGEYKGQPAIHVMNQADVYPQDWPYAAVRGMKAGKNDRTKIWASQMLEGELTAFGKDVYFTPTLYKYTVPSVKPITIEDISRPLAFDFDAPQIGDNDRVVLERAPGRKKPLAKTVG